MMVFYDLFVFDIRYHSMYTHGCRPHILQLSRKRAYSKSFGCLENSQDLRHLEPESLEIALFHLC